MTTVERTRVKVVRDYYQVRKGVILNFDTQGDRGRDDTGFPSRLRRLILFLVERTKIDP